MKFLFKHWGNFIILATVILVVYFPALFTFFAQDDFTHLAISEADSIGAWLKFFLPRNDVIFYRPISVQIYTWISRQIFGLNPLGYHLLALAVHTLATYGVFRLISFWKDKRAGLIGAIIYGTHPSHFMSLFWVAEFSMVASPAFVFMAMAKFVNKKFNQFYVWLLLALLSNELAMVVPGILTVYILINKQNHLWKRLLPAWVMITLLSIFRLMGSPILLGTEYALSINPLIWWANLRWYLFRSIGLAEGWRAYMGNAEMVIAVSALILFWIVWIMTSLKKLRGRSNLIWGLAWFGLSLVPAVVLARHQSPIYSLVGLPGFILAMMAISNLNKTRLVMIATGLWIIASFWSVRAQMDYHWVTQRAKIAEYHLDKLKHRRLEVGDIVAFLNTVPNSSSAVYMALGGENAVKVFFGADKQVLFEDYDLIPINNVVLVLSRNLNQQHLKQRAQR